MSRKSLLQQSLFTHVKDGGNYIFLSGSFLSRLVILEICCIPVANLSIAHEYMTAIIHLCCF